MTQDQIIEKIAAYLVQETAFAGITAPPEADEALIEGGLLDSLGILSLIAFLEQEFDLVFDEEDISAEHFATLRTMADLVHQKR